MLRRAKVSSTQFLSYFIASMDVSGIILLLLNDVFSIGTVINSKENQWMWTKQLMVDVRSEVLTAVTEDVCLLGYNAL
jgi:hypothetical protein